ncbi:hypothetical protein ANO11243_059740 [Dothideomycetidae sp. 11243]|nr:hypothetical protein ANO11243_059740 [fungal sp. No.11243]
MALQHKLPAGILDLILFNPVTDTYNKSTSYATFKHGPFLTEASMDWMVDAFLPNEADRKNAMTSPLTFASDEVLRQFPRTLIILADLDPLVDEGRNFADRLQKLGVDAAVVRAVGQMHAFFLLKPTRQSPTARMIVEMVTARIQRAFMLPMKV